MRVDGKIALITGGSRGLGFEMARALGSAGARVVITARKADELEAAKSLLQAEGIDATSYPHDLSAVETAELLTQAIRADVGEVDILVNNAGRTWGGPAADLDWTNWQKVVDVNLNGTWALTQAVAREMMIPRKSGNIVFVASVGGLGAVPPKGTPTVAYNTTKAAQINLVRALASEWGQYNIRVNALAPGWFGTKMTLATLEAAGHAALDRIPAGRYGIPEQDIPGPVLFLASEASSYITGHTLVLDGGISATVG